ncbi:hypothetical protein A3K73_09030 [Candidatus Pacearchaeota archaeon RBG_13_36_9]|nr:MAG: hypothetical protein A3K73_09030 [Candidatus Pacearchaeota archaeon RBG_13_36_9]
MSKRNKRKRKWEEDKMTKQKISITLDEEMIKIIETVLKDAQFRNRSHVIEYSLKKFLEKKLD